MRPENEQGISRPCSVHERPSIFTSQRSFLYVIVGPIREEEEKVQSFEEEEIPEHLLPRPEDTEEERLAKKKRIQRYEGFPTPV